MLLLHSEQDRAINMNNLGIFCEIHKLAYTELSTLMLLRTYVIRPTDIEDLNNLKANKMDVSKANFIVSRAKFILLNSKLSFYLRFYLT